MKVRSTAHFHVRSGNFLTCSTKGFWRIKDPELRIWWHLFLNLNWIYRRVMPVSREQVLQVFTLSRQSETAVGLRIRGRLSLLITNLEQISGTDPQNTVLTVCAESIYGETLQANRYSLEQIDQIFNLRIRYNDPFYQYLRSLRSNIRNIREGSGLGGRTTSV